MVRFFDILLSMIALLLLSPILMPIVIVLRGTGEGKIFFLQERVGRYQKKIRIIKFATMLENSPNIGTGTITTKNDPRILPVGKYLRKTKINELPQLINILIGDMSFIGPRPLTERNFNYYPSEYRKIITKVRPGLSGVGSVIFRNEEEILNNQSEALGFYRDNIAPYKGEVEVWFEKKNGLTVYFILIALTIWIVIMPKSNLIWRVFISLPPPPKILKQALRRES